MTDPLEPGDTVPVKLSVRFTMASAGSAGNVTKAKLNAAALSVATIGTPVDVIEINAYCILDFISGLVK
jgi:hypothetical protein